MIIMTTIFYRPVLNIIRKREEYISKNYEDAKSLSDNAQNYKVQKEEKLQQVRIECRKKIEHAIDDAQAVSNRVINFHREKTKVKIQSEKEALHEKENKLKSEINSSVVNEISSAITNKILKGTNGINA